MNFKKKFPHIFFFLIGIIFFFVQANAQVSLVPSNHQVYDWLLHQRVAGNISNYNYESLPLSRGQILTHLKEIKTKYESGDLKWKLSVSDRHFLSSYLLEFDHNRIGENEFYKTILDTSSTYVQRVKNVWNKRPNPHLFTYLNEKEKINGVFTLRSGSDEISNWEDSNWLWSRSYITGLKAFGSFYDFVGIHVEVDNLSILGDQETLNNYPPYSYAFTVTEQQKGVSQTYENSFSLKKGVLRFDISSGSIQIGPNLSEPLFLSRDAANMNWLRFNIDLDWFSYTAIHGSLYARTTISPLVVGVDTVLTRTAPERYLVLHRLTLRPLNWVEISLTEMLLYSNRTPDYSYLNIANPIFFSELDNGDRDNAFLGADIILRPLAGTELFASILIDDLVSWGQILKDEPTFDDDVAVNFGYYQTLPYGIRFGSSYTRIEPFVYTHWQRLNTFEQRNRSLGHILGPNSDELSFQLKKYLPYRAWITGQISFIRKGLNTEEQNIGGDLLRGDGNRGFTMFQDSDRHSWVEYKLESQIEPIRGFILSGELRRRVMTSGDLIPDFTSFILSYRFGF